MCSFIISTKQFDDPRLNIISSKRGPDYTNKCKIDKFNIIHNLLDISQKKLIQPIVREDIIMLFNGEIYEPNTNEDSLTLIPLYQKHGVRFVETINGEYAIVIIDKINECIFLYSDIFATKPLFYSVEENHIGIASYSSELQILNFKQINKVPASTLVKIDIKTLKIESDKHNLFNLNEYKTSYEDCILALEKSISVRCNKKVAVGISSGHDSGAILQWCLKYNKQNANFYYVHTNAEDVQIINERRNKCKNKNISFKTIDYYHKQGIYNLLESKYMEVNMENYNFYKDEDSTFLLSNMMKTIKKDNIDIFVSGQGSDEILSNYLKNPKDFFVNWQNIFPWNNFYKGKNEFYINQLEYIGGSFGIEVRYPFLDKFFVQEFLNLTNYLKTKKYKSVISEYLLQLKLNAKIQKVGMAIYK